MDRRHFIGGVAIGVLAGSRAARTQPAHKVYRIGILGTVGTTTDMIGAEPGNPIVAALLRGLREQGYVYRQDFVTEPRAGESNPERFPVLATELVRLQVDVIVAAGPFLPALKQATSTLPIVMAGAIDPVGQGLVRSLAHPGGNFTGLSNQSADLAGKRLELLKDLVPTTALVAVLWDRTVISGWHVAEAAGRARGWKLMSIEVRDASEIDSAIKAAADARAGALLVLAGGLLFPQSARIAELATRNRLPTMFGLRPSVEAGGLSSYGADINDIWRRAAVFVDKILKGAKPADIAVEQPTKFELVINLKTAKALGLAIPQSLLLRADEVIQ